MATEGRTKQTTDAVDAGQLRGHSSIAHNRDWPQQPVELEHIIGYSARHGALCFHPKDNNKLLYPVGAAVLVTDTIDPNQQTILRGHDAHVTSIDISPDGEFLATGQCASAKFKGIAPIILWNYGPKTQHHVLEGISREVLYLRFSPDSRLVAASGADNSFVVWNVETGDVISSSRTEEPIMGFDWGEVKQNPRSKSNPTYRVCVAHKTVDDWTLEYSLEHMQYQCKRKIYQFPTAARLVRKYTSVSIAPDNVLVMVGTNVGDIIVLNTENLIYRTHFQVSSCGCGDLVMTKNFAISGGGDGTVAKLGGEDSTWAWDAKVKLQGSVVTVAATSDGSIVAVGTSEGRLYRLDTDTLKVTEVCEGHTSIVVSLAFGEHSHIFATIAESGIVRMWDLTDYGVMWHAQGPAKGTCLVFDEEDFGVLLAGFDDGSFAGYDEKTGEKMWQIAQASRGPVTALCGLAPYIATGGTDGALRLWDRKTHTFLTQISPHRKEITAIVRDYTKADQIHSCSTDQRVVTTSLKTQRMINYKQVSNGGFTDMCQRTDSELELVTSLSDGRVLFWDCDIAKPVQTMVDKKGRAYRTCSLAPDGRYIAIGGESAVLQVISMTDDNDFMGRCVGHTEPITRVRWTPDQKQIISVGEDTSVCVWNVYERGPAPEEQQKALTDQGREQ